MDIYKEGLRQYLISGCKYKRTISEENEIKVDAINGLYNSTKLSSMSPFKDIVLIYHDNDGSFNRTLETDNFSKLIFAKGEIATMNKNYITLKGYPQFWQVENIVNAISSTAIDGWDRTITKSTPSFKIFNFYSIDSHLKKTEYSFADYNPLGAYITATKVFGKDKNKVLTLDSIDNWILMNG